MRALLAAAFAGALPLAACNTRTASVAPPVVMKDTLFRIHGTNEPDKIGQAVPSGRIRMLNADVMDLYDRVPIGSKVVVR